MADINDLAQRITAALERINQGVDRLDGAAASQSDVDASALKEALEAEKLANAQLEERVVAIKERQEKVVQRLEDEVARLKEQGAARDGENDQLKFVNERLSRNNKALREANAQGLGNTDLINAGLAAELDAVRVRRETDRSEMQELIDTLKPLVEGEENA